MAKIQTACTIEPELHERLRLVAIVDRRSIAEVAAECIERALPHLEAELQRPRLSPEMVARLKAGERLEEVLRSNLAPFAPSVLNETPAPYAPVSATPPAPAPAPPAASAAPAKMKRPSKSARFSTH